jgi:hypothetical protein
MAHFQATGEMPPRRNRHGCLKAIGVIGVVGVVGLGALYQINNTARHFGDQIADRLFGEEEHTNSATYVTEMRKIHVPCVTATTWHTEVGATVREGITEKRVDQKRDGFTLTCFDGDRVETPVEVDPSNNKVRKVKLPPLLAVTHVEPINPEDPSRNTRTSASLTARVQGMFGMPFGGDGVDFTKPEALAYLAVDNRAANLNCREDAAAKARESAEEFYKGLYGSDIIIEPSTEPPQVMISKDGVMTYMPIEQWNRETLGTLNTEDNSVEFGGNSQCGVVTKDGDIPTTATALR